MWESLKGTPKNRKKKLNRGVRGEMVSSARVLIEVPVRVNGVLTKGLRKVHGGNSCGNIGCKKCSSLWREMSI